MNMIMLVIDEAGASNCAIYFSETEKIIKNKFHLVDLSVA